MSYFHTKLIALQFVVFVAVGCTGQVHQIDIQIPDENRRNPLIGQIIDCAERNLYGLSPARTVYITNELVDSIMVYFKSRPYCDKRLENRMYAEAVYYMLETANKINNLDYECFVYEGHTYILSTRFTINVLGKDTKHMFVVWKSDTGKQFTIDPWKYKFADYQGAPDLKERWEKELKSRRAKEH